MISFRTKDDMVSSLIAITAILILAGTLGFMLFVKPPNEQKVSKDKLVRDYKEKTERSKQEYAKAKAAIDPVLWTEAADKVSPQALSSITKLAQEHHLKVVAFRPQKPVDAEGLTQIPFSISVDGAYPDTMQLVKDLETSNTKLAVSLVQVMAADAASDHVTGTINVVAYTKAATPPTSTTKGGSSAQKS